MNHNYEPPNLTGPQSVTSLQRRAPAGAEPARGSAELGYFFSGPFRMSAPLFLINGRSLSRSRTGLIWLAWRRLSAWYVTCITCALGIPGYFKRCNPPQNALGLLRDKGPSYEPGAANFFKGGLIMPALLPSANRAWSCSECQAAFDMEPLDELALTQVQIERVNHIFELHCQHMHRGTSPVSGVERGD